MPARFRIKEYRTGAYYHIYNKGIEGREIFRDNEDFEMFEKYLERYLTEYKEDKTGRYKPNRPSVVTYRQSMSLNLEVRLVSYCLMPNHYHLVVVQESGHGITKLMRRVLTSYVMYFNGKYNRRGPLFENVYRGVLLNGVEQVVGVTRLIHLNPEKRTRRRFGLVESVIGTTAQDYLYSSYSQYIGNNIEIWINPVYGDIEPSEYRRYVETIKSEAETEYKKLMVDE